jgi:hypothetical protein
MPFKMKVADIFKMSNGTIVLAGDLETDQRYIGQSLCLLQIDGEVRTNLLIEGVVMGAGARGNLWTRSQLSLDREFIAAHDVWLMSSP